LVFFNDIERHNYIPLVATNQYSKVVYATRQQYSIRLGYSITHLFNFQDLKKLPIFL